MTVAATVTVADVEQLRDAIFAAEKHIQDGDEEQARRVLIEALRRGEQQR
jgi:hypothetical protein